MFLEIDEVLTQAEVERLRVLAKGARFAEGRLSNPHTKVKNNLQIDHADPAHAEASSLMARALDRNESFRNFAYPRALAPPMLARYVPGMHYGAHTDAAFLPVGQRPLRSDISCTLFIADPGAYQGGELSIHLGSRAVTFKGKPGAEITSPPHTLH